MYSMALVMKVVIGWNIHTSIWISSLTVAVYVALGGLRSAIFNEVLQFMLIWLGALLVPILGLIEPRGFGPLKEALIRNTQSGGCDHLWKTTGSFTANQLRIKWLGLAVG